MVVDEFLLHLLRHAGQGVELTLEFPLQSGQRGGDLLFHFFVLSLGQTGVEWVALQGAPATDTGGNDEFALHEETKMYLCANNGKV